MGAFAGVSMEPDERSGFGTHGLAQRAHSVNVQERPCARTELRESDRLKLLLDMANTLVSNLGLRDLLRAVLASIRQVMHCDGVGVWLPDPEQGQLRHFAVDFPEGKGFLREDLVRPVEGFYIGSVFKTGKPVVRTKSEILNDPGNPLARAEGIESICALPLISRNRTLGVLTLATRVENSFCPQDIDFLLRAAGQVAIAIENALAFEEIAELKDKLAEEKFYPQ